jgi:transposase
MDQKDVTASRKFVGVDLHTTQMTCCFLSEDGSQTKATFGVTPDEIERFRGCVDKDTYVIVEATKGAFAFYEKIRDAVADCFVANPHKLRLISMVDKKTDKIDAEKLAKYLKMQIMSGENLFKPVYVPEAEIQTLRSLFASWKLFAKQLAMTKNAIHGLLHQHLIVISKRDLNSAVGRERLRAMALPVMVKRQIEIFIKNLESLENYLEEIKREIYLIGRKYEAQIEILTSIKGISPFIALALIADIADISRFPDAKHLSSYLRSSPGIDSSNNSTKILRTTKFGRKLSITMLTQAILHIRKSNAQLMAWDKSKRGKKSAGRIRMAECRKTIVHIYSMLTKKQFYRYVDPDNHAAKMREYRSVVQSMVA